MVKALNAWDRSAFGNVCKSRVVVAYEFETCEALSCIVP